VFAVNMLHPTAVMLRLGPYKLVWDGRAGAGDEEGYTALYDLAADLGERRNLLREPGAEAVKRRMYQAMHEYLYHGGSRPGRTAES
jgi:hypothetical protein